MTPLITILGGVAPASRTLLPSRVRSGRQVGRTRMDAFGRLLGIWEPHPEMPCLARRFKTLRAALID